MIRSNWWPPARWIVGFLCGVAWRGVAEWSGVEWRCRAKYSGCGGSDVRVIPESEWESEWQKVRIRVVRCGLAMWFGHWEEATVFPGNIPTPCFLWRVCPCFIRATVSNVPNVSNVSNVSKLDFSLVNAAFSCRQRPLTVFCHLLSWFLPYFPSFVASVHLSLFFTPVHHNV